MDTDASIRTDDFIFEEDGQMENNIEQTPTATSMVQFPNQMEESECNDDCHFGNGNDTDVLLHGEHQNNNHADYVEVLASNSRCKHRLD